METTISRASGLGRFFLKLIAFLIKPATITGIAGAIIGFGAQAGLHWYNERQTTLEAEQRDKLNERRAELNQIRAEAIKDANLSAMDEPQLDRLIEKWAKMNLLYQSPKATDIINTTVAELKAVRNARVDERRALEARQRLEREEAEAIKQKNEAAAKLAREKAAAQKKKEDEARELAIRRAQAIELRFLRMPFAH